MAELPSKSVTEEKYEDENGHIVVKKVKVLELSNVKTRQVRLGKNKKTFHIGQKFWSKVSEANVCNSVLVVSLYHTSYQHLTSDQRPVYLYLPQVTRKIIRKCISEEGVEDEWAPSKGDPQGNISMTEGDGYSKVVKRTVIRSEGDHSEVCAVCHVCDQKVNWCS